MKPGGGMEPDCVGPCIPQCIRILLSTLVGDKSRTAGLHCLANPVKWPGYLEINSDGEMKVEMNEAFVV